MRRTFAQLILKLLGPARRTQSAKGFATLVVGISLAGSHGAECQVSKPGQQPARRDLFVRAVQLEKQKDYAQSSALLKQYLEKTPGDQLARCLLLNIDVLTHEKLEAIEQLSVLKRSPIPSSLEGIVTKLETSVRNFEMERSLNNALEALKPVDAVGVIDSMYLTSQQKELLKYYIDLRQGNLASALLRAMILDHPSATGSAVLPSEFRNKVVQDTELLTKLHQRIDWYRYSALTNGSCTSDWIRQEIPKENYEIQQEYMKLIANSEKEFPLSSWVLDHAFFATLLSDRPYEDLESFGDAILEAKGSLRIPFYARDALFDLVIDARTRHIRTELDPHVRLNESGSDKMQNIASFDLAFDQVKSIDQKASADLASGGLASGSYALRLEPMGLAPRYAFMDAIQCLDGEAKQKAVTEKLGQYIAHVTAASRPKVHLVDPNRKTVDWVRATSTTLAIGTVAGAQVVNVRNNGTAVIQTQAVSQEAMKVVAQNKADADAEKRIVLAQNEERKVWHEDLTNLIFSAIDAKGAEVLATVENKLIALADSAANN
jgi:hypothetical protein